jgi:tetratricopeptide (TPR) repeat protein
MEEDCESAEKFLMMAYNINPNAYTYKGLASIYQIRGEKEKAHEMWGKALQTDNKRLKVEVLQTLYDIQRDEGDYKKASETAMQIVALKDSIAQREKEENIRGIQEQYEIEHQAMAEKARTNMIIYLTASLLFLAVALATYLYYRMTKGRQELKEVRKQLEQHRLQLKVLEQEGKTDTKEVENLKQKISELQTKQGALLQNGRERYEEMMAGGTTIRWSRNDFMDAVEYYRTVDADFINHMEQDYKHLSSKYIFFSLLEHLGKTDEELQHIMAISQNTIRSYRSRINHSLIQG